MTRSLFLNDTSAVAMMIIDFPDAGDDGLFSMEFAHQHIKQAYAIRIAALHLHIAARSRIVTVKERLLEQMVELAYCPDVEDSLYLSPLDWLFVDQPPFMKAKELGDVLATEVQQEDGPFYCPACRERVIVKKGWVKAPHFAHLPDADCSYIGEGESDDHQLACQCIHGGMTYG